MKYLVVLLLFTNLAYATEYRRERSTEPAVSTQSTGDVSVTVAPPSVTTDAVADAAGGAGGNAAGGSATGGSAGGNTFDAGDNSYFALSVGAPNISGCLVGGSAGGGDGGTGGLFQWGRLNLDCFMNEMSMAERHIETRATLKCGSRKVRRAIAYRTPNASAIEKTDICISHFSRVWAQEIDYLVGLVVDKEEPPGKK